MITDNSDVNKIKEDFLMKDKNGQINQIEDRLKRYKVAIF